MDTSMSMGFRYMGTCMGSTILPMTVLGTLTTNVRIGACTKAIHPFLHPVAPPNYALLICHFMFVMLTSSPAFSS
jgi:hypothetical protein